MSNQLKWLSAGSLALIGESEAGWIWGLFELRLRVLRAKVLEALNGGEPRYKAIIVFPFVNLCHSSTWLASDLASRFGAILIGLLIWKIEIYPCPKLGKGSGRPCFIPSCLWFNAAAESGLGDDNHFLILQMALLWALAKASPSLPSTLLLVLLGLGLAPLMLLRYESWLMLPVIADFRCSLSKNPEV